MKKNWILLPGFALVLLMSSCNNGGETGTVDNADTLSDQKVAESVVAECTTQNAITVTVKNYEMS
ncbi:MAG: hypothetical protein ABIJ16_01070, partial [Bacteroidota bacterium]